LVFHQTAELDDRVARIEQVSDAELTRIVIGGRTDEADTSLARRRCICGNAGAEYRRHYIRDPKQHASAQKVSR